MMKISTLDSKLQATEVNYEFSVLDIPANKVALAKYERAYSFNQRQGNAEVKDRGEVSGGGRKPWKQKGTGRARHGSTRSPIWTKGGVTFGPTNNVNWNLKINKKEKLIAFVTAFKMRTVAETLNICELPEVQKTKDIVEIIGKLAGSKGKKLNKVVIVTDKALVYKAANNLEGVKVFNTKDLSAHQLLLGSTVVFDTEAFNTVMTAKQSLFEKIM